MDFGLYFQSEEQLNNSKQILRTIETKTASPTIHKKIAGYKKKKILYFKVPIEDKPVKNKYKKQEERKRK